MAAPRPASGLRSRSAAYALRRSGRPRARSRPVAVERAAVLNLDDVPQASTPVAAPVACRLFAACVACRCACCRRQASERKRRAHFSLGSSGLPLVSRSVVRRLPLGAFALPRLEKIWRLGRGWSCRFTRCAVAASCRGGLRLSCQSRTPGDLVRKVSPLRLLRSSLNVRAAVVRRGLCRLRLVCLCLAYRRRRRSCRCRPCRRGNV